MSRNDRSESDAYRHRPEATPPGVTVREATIADAESIADAHAKSVRDLGSEAYDDRQVRAWLSNVPPERYPFEAADTHVVVAEREGVDDAASDSGEIAGFGLLECDPDGPNPDSDPDAHGDSTGEIGALYVHPGHVREGIGRAILETLESAARDAGLETLVLTASRNAVGFYRRQGFEGIETVVLEMDDGVSLACLRMRTRLE